MKLYEVTAQIVTYLVSEDEPDQYDMADAAEKEVRDNPYQTTSYCRELTKIEEIPEEIRNTLPYVAPRDSCLTLQGWIDKLASERKPPDNPNQKKMFDTANQGE